MTTFALVSDTKRVSQETLYKLSVAMQQSAFDCAQTWNLAQPVVVAVDSFDALSRLRDVHPIVLTDSEGPSNTLGYHYWDVFRAGPAARVFVPASSGLSVGAHSISETCSHEIVEAMVDPQINKWSDMPGRAGMQMALEIADMTQDTYTVYSHGEAWQLANFVTPAYFESKLLEPEAAERFAAKGGLFDFAGRLKAPGDIGPAGYAIVRVATEAGWKTYPIYGRAFSLTAEKEASKRHPWARTMARGAWVEFSRGIPDDEEPTRPEIKLRKESKHG